MVMKMLDSRRPLFLKDIVEGSQTTEEILAWESWERSPVLHLYDTNQGCILARRQFKRFVEGLAYRGRQDGLFPVRRVVGEDEDALYRLTLVDLGLAGQSACLAFKSKYERIDTDRETGQLAEGVLPGRQWDHQ